MQYDLILGVLVCYLIVLVGIGLYFSRKVKSKESFYLADHKLGTFLLTATITATAVGGSATIATGALIYRNGLPGLWLDIGGAIGLIVLGLLLAKKVRKTGLFTLPEITGYLFDEKTRFASAILVVMIEIAWASLLIQATSTILSILLPIEYEVLLIGITLVFIMYTLLGGQFAVVYTDFIQFIMMTIGVCVLAAPLLFIQASSGFSSLPVGHLSFPVNESLGFLPVLSFFFMMLMPHIVGPDIYSKVLSARDEKTARKASIFSGVFKFIFAISIGVIALSALVLVPGLSASESALAVPMAISYLHPVLAGFILAAFVSVMLSSADSVLLSAGTVLSVDLLSSRLWKKKILTKESHYIFSSRIGILLVGVCALLLALVLQDIINTLKLAYTVFTAGLTLPIIFGFFKEKTKVTSTGALMSLILGGGISLIWLYLNSPYIDAVLVGLLVSLIPLLICRKK